MPCRTIVDTAVLDFLGLKVTRDNRSLRLAPLPVDVRIIVVRLFHNRIKYLKDQRCGTIRGYDRVPPDLDLRRPRLAFTRGQASAPANTRAAACGSSTATKQSEE